MLAASACLGLAVANALRCRSVVIVVLAVLAGLVCTVAGEALERVALLSVALLLAGWWWGSARLAAIDSSVLLGHVGEAAVAHAVVTGPVRGGEFDLRVPATLVRFGELAFDEPVLLELPVGRSPPQGRSSRSTLGCVCRDPRRRASTSARGCGGTASTSSFSLASGGSSATAGGWADMPTVPDPGLRAAWRPVSRESGVRSSKGSCSARTRA
jgi:hypothetical protein